MKKPLLRLISLSFMIFIAASQESEIHQESENGDVETVRRLLAEDPSLVNSISGEENLTPLHCAARSGRAEVVRILLESGADIEARSKAGRTAINYAAENGDLETVKTLAEAGADIDSKPCTGEYPLFIAAGNDNLEVMLYLMDKGAKVEPVEHNCEGKYIDVGGYTPLHAAAEKGSMRTARALLDRGADPNTRSSVFNGCVYPIHLAVKENRREMVELLLKGGADPNVRAEVNHWGDVYPIHLATKDNHADMVRLLIDNGADPNARDYPQRNPLHVAVQHKACEKDRKMCDILINAGTDINAKDIDGNTPLHLASKDVNVFLYLKEKGADPKIKNNIDQTPNDLLRHNMIYPFILPFFELRDAISDFIEPYVWGPGVP